MFNLIIYRFLHTFEKNLRKGTILLYLSFNTMDHNSPNIDRSLLSTYKDTTYNIEQPELAIRIGETNKTLNVFLFDNNSYSWAFISACNPHSVPLSDEENDRRHKDLVEQVQSMKWRFCIGWGTPANEGWKAEKSLFIFDISKAQAIELGKAFHQNAIVFGRLNQAPELVLCR